MKAWLVAVLVLVAALLTTPAAAHGIWFAERSGALALIYGHGGEDLDIIKRQERVGAAAGYDVAGAPVPVKMRRTDHLLLVDMPKAAVVVTGVLDNGYWSKSADGKWINGGRDEVPDATESGRYIKFAIHLRASLKAPLAALPGQTLQIVPVRARLPEHKDEPMTVRVLYQGKPLAGARVTRDYVGDPDAKPLVSGKDGTVTLRVRNQGLNVITASHDAPPDDAAKAAKTGLLASLSFVVKHAPE